MRSRGDHAFVGSGTGEAILVSDSTAVRDTWETLREARQSLSELRELSSQEIAGHILRLRAQSLRLYKGVDLYGWTFDQMLSAIRGSGTRSEASTNRWLDAEGNADLWELSSTIYRIQTQLEIVADYRSELESSYSELLGRGYPITGELRTLYIRLRTLLTEQPEQIFRMDDEQNKEARQLVEDGLSAFREVLSRERPRWAREDAIRERVAALSSELEDTYKKAEQSHGPISQELYQKYQTAREVLSQPLDVLATEAESQDLDSVQQTIDALQIHITRDDQAKSDEAVEASLRAKQLRSLLLAIGIFIALPIALIVGGLVVLIYSLGGEAGLDVKIPVLGVPYSILFWSALGSVASMLHFVNTYRERHFLVGWRMFRWAFTRPLTGILMGMLVYLVAYAGLLIAAQAQPSNYGFLSALAFVAGFSDRVQQAVIRLVVGQIPINAQSEAPEQSSEAATEAALDTSAPSPDKKED
jgi:hypothetical protein